jgi:hypothetical protein
MGHILAFWYLDSPSWTYHAFLRTLGNLEGHFAVVDTAKNIKKPIFQDYTLQGRAIGVFIRLVRICLGSFFYLLTGLLFIFLYGLWLFFPAICLVTIAAAFFGNS